MSEQKFHLVGHPFSLTMPANNGDGRSRDQLGQRAFSPTRGLIGRWHNGETVRGPRFGFSRISADPHGGETFQAIDVAHEPTFDDAKLQSAMNGRPVYRFDPDVKRAERERYKASFPSLPLPDVLMPPAEHSIFPLGETWIAPPADERRDCIDWPDILARHGQGDHGELGVYDPALVTEESLFCEAMEPPAVQNAIVIGRRWGMIYGRYHVAGLGPKPQPFAPAPPDYGVVLVVTEIAPGRAKTLARFVSP
jgi:hypothetical protein